MDSPNYWYCDHCGEKIESAKAGYVVWETNDKRQDHGFRIVHTKKCDVRRESKSAALADFLGLDGLTYLLSFLSHGPIQRGHGRKAHVEVSDMDEFVDFVRRVQLPYYDEARRKFDHPEVRSDYYDHTESSPYTQRYLKKIAEGYQPEE